MNYACLKQSLIVAGDRIVVIRCNGPVERGAQRDGSRSAHMFPQVTAIVDPQAALAGIKLKKQIAAGKICQTASEGSRSALGKHVPHPICIVDAEAAEVMH